LSIYDFHGKHALVSGGTTGIGRAVAEALQAAGCDVVVASLPGGPPLHSDIRLASCDVTSAEDLDRLFADITHLDIVVHCAGTIARGEEFRPEVFRRTIDVNLISAMEIATRARPLLARNGGSIVNTASMLSFFGGGLVPAYSASKGGIVQLTKSLAIAWAEQGIRVNAVAPGWIATGFTEALQNDPQRSRQIIDRTPMKRWGTPQEIAEPILFLCSPGATFITGTTLVVDGGYSAY
jgi:NAD(P)-dependent dehydrogenase (short-subunit alcohol dehydrogenase family)